MNVLHLYGTPYEMGYAHGQLLSPQIKQLYSELYPWIYEQIEQSLEFLPQVVQNYIAEFGVAAGLDFTWAATKDFWPAHWQEEMQGLADGAGVPYSQVVQVHMFPELTKASCSMWGAWGPAIAKVGGSLYQLRALDWATNGPFQQYPTLFVYHPGAGNGSAFSSLAWSGFIGGLTGFSSNPVGVCEKVWLGYNGTQNVFGYPFPFLLRDIMQFDVDADSALSRIATAERTCSIFIGLGDYTNTFKIVEYSYDYVEIKVTGV